MKDDKIYIEHILQSIERIESYIYGKNHKWFAEDYLTQDAVIRQLEIIGEATKRISPTLRSINPHIPWQDMAGMRDILIYNYIDVDIDIVWKTASESIPELKILVSDINYQK